MGGDLSEADLAAAAMRYGLERISGVEWALCRQVPQAEDEAAWLVHVWEPGDEGDLILCRFHDNPLTAMMDAVEALALPIVQAARGAI
jgi:hypothetical protein